MNKHSLHRRAYRAMFGDGRTFGSTDMFVVRAMEWLSDNTTSMHVVSGESGLSDRTDGWTVGIRVDWDVLHSYWGSTPANALAAAVLSFAKLNRIAA